MTVQVNGVTLEVTHKETTSVYKQDVWFIKYSTTNIIDIKNLIRKYRLTYDNTDKIFVVHRDREDQEKPNTEFKMHEYVLHC